MLTQSPCSPPDIRQLPIKYDVLSRFWIIGVSSLLKLLLRQPSASREFFLQFLYYAYHIVTLLLECASQFKYFWVESLGDLCRYRLSIEQENHPDRAAWSQVAEMWYTNVLDDLPNLGRLSHHLGIVAHPDILRQLYLFSKATLSVTPYKHAQKSLKGFLLQPVLQQEDDVLCDSWIVSALVQTCALHLNRSSIIECKQPALQIVSAFQLPPNRARTLSQNFPEITLVLFTALFDFGTPDSILLRAYQDGDQAESESMINSESPSQSLDGAQEEKNSLDRFNRGSSSVVAQLIYVCSRLVLNRHVDNDVASFGHILLAFLYSLSFNHSALQHLENQEAICWSGIVQFLNKLPRSGIVFTHLEQCSFPPAHSPGRQLPEDFLIRGFMWAKLYLPAGHFESLDEDGREIEQPSHSIARIERCLWLGIQLAKVRASLPPAIQTVDVIPNTASKMVYI